MFRNPPGVTGQGYGDKPFTYIHTYMHTHKHLFLHSSQAAAAIMGGGCPSLRRIPMPSETPHDQWEGSHPRRHVCMRGLGCLFAAESNGIVQSLLRVISRRLRVVEWTWRWTLEAAARSESCVIMIVTVSPYHRPVGMEHAS